MTVAPATGLSLSQDGIAELHAGIFSHTAVMYASVTKCACLSIS
jgi:hypothetical protein